MKLPIRVRRLSLIMPLGKDAFLKYLNEILARLRSS
jgi:hypothetical protein